jgi:hypothetical protein
MGKTELGEETGVEERDDPGDPGHGGGEHVNRVRSVDAVVTASVRRDCGLSIGVGGNHPKCSGRTKNLCTDEPPDSIPPTEPG